MLAVVDQPSGVTETRMSCLQPAAAGPDLFPICPDEGDPDGCNVFRDLVFPDEVYERIEEYHYQKMRPQTAGYPGQR